MTTQNDYGHVDAEGNVFLAGEAGPTKIGQFAAGDPAEGLAFFTKRYHDLVAEIELSVARLKEGKANVESVTALVERIAASIETPNLLGDLKALEVHKTDLLAKLEEAKVAKAAKRAEQKAASLAKREELVAQAESLSNSTAWKVTGEKYKELLEEWKKLPSGDRGVEQELWKRFSHARSVFDKARRIHFAALDATRGEALTGKKALIAKAQELSTSTDWAASTTTFKKLMDEWKTLPRASKSDEDKLWKQFKAAQDAFFDARNAANSVRDGEFAENLVAKEALAVQAEAILPVTDIEAAKTALRVIQEKWEKVGHVPRNDKEKIEKRLKAVEDAIRKQQEAIWHRSKPEVIDRANTLVNSFQAALSKIEASLEKASAANKADEVAKLTEQRAQTVALLEAAQAGASTLG